MAENKSKCLNQDLKDKSSIINRDNVSKDDDKKRVQDDGSYYDNAGNLYDADGYVICTRG